MTYTFELLQKIALQENVAYGLIKRVATQPIPGQIYDANDINVVALEDYLTHRLTKSAFDTVAELVAAAELLELPVKASKPSKAKQYAIPEIGAQFFNKNGIYTVLYANNDIVLGHTENVGCPSYARYKVVSLATFDAEKSAE